MPKELFPKLKSVKNRIERLAKQVQMYCKLFAHRTTIHECNRCFASSWYIQMGRQAPADPRDSSGNLPDMAKSLQEQPNAPGEGYPVPRAGIASILVHMADLAEQITFLTGNRGLFEKFAKEQTKSFLAKYDDLRKTLRKFRNVFNHPEYFGGMPIRTKKEWEPILATRKLQEDFDCLLCSIRLKLNAEVWSILEQLDCGTGTSLRADIYRNVIERLNSCGDAEGASQVDSSLKKLDIKHSQTSCLSGKDCESYTELGDLKDVALKLVQIGTALWHSKKETFMINIDNIQTIPAQFVHVPYYCASGSKLENYVEHYKLAASWLNMPLNIVHANATNLASCDIEKNTVIRNMHASYIATGFQMLWPHIKLYKHNSELHDAAIVERLLDVRHRLRVIAAHGPECIEGLYQPPFYFGKLDIELLEKRHEVDSMEHDEWLSELQFACCTINRFYFLACKHEEIVKYPPLRKCACEDCT